MPAPVTALVGGRVLPIDAAPIENGTVLIDGDRIAAVGDLGGLEARRSVDCAGRRFNMSESSRTVCS